MKKILLRRKIALNFFFFLTLILISNHKTTSLKLEMKLKSKSSNALKTELLSNSKGKFTIINCNSPCLECSVSDFNYCTRCNNLGFYLNFGCYTTCPEGTYSTRETRTCEKCNNNCPVCWGSESNMCGTTPGVISQVVEIEEEIKNYFKINKISTPFIDTWLNILSVIFEEEKEKFLPDGPHTIKVDTFSTNQVYGALNDKIYELPIGSFSKLGGVFIPVPPYINQKNQIVESHWIYKKGMWDGKRWIAQSFPRLPSFIKQKGQTNLIYKENGGFWAWDQMKDWYWIKVQNWVEPNVTVQSVLDNLANIKFDVNGICIIY